MVCVLVPRVGPRSILSLCLGGMLIPYLAAGTTAASYVLLLAALLAASLAAAFRVRRVPRPVLESGISERELLVHRGICQYCVLALAECRNNTTNRLSEASRKVIGRNNNFPTHESLTGSHS